MMASIANIIKETLQCEYACLCTVETDHSIITQLYPEHSSIHSFNDGILGYVAQKKQFISFNDHQEKLSLGIASLNIEDNMKISGSNVKSLLCIPIFSKDSNDICGLILVTNSYSTFTHLDIEVIQLLGIEIGNILERSATALLIESNQENDALRSWLELCRVPKPHSPSISTQKSVQLDMNIVQQPLSELAHEADENHGFLACTTRLSDVFSDRRSTIIAHMHRSEFNLKDVEESSCDTKGTESTGSKSRGALLWKSGPNIRGTSTKVIGRSASIGLLGGSQKTETATSSVRVKPKQIAKRRRGSVGGTLSIADVMLNKQSIVEFVNSTTKPLRQMVELTFDPFTCNLSDIPQLTVKIFDDLDLIHGLKIPIVPFINFIKQISGLYRNSNPYHNVYHGFSVLTFTYSFIKKTDLHMSKVDLFAMLIASFCHDVDHPGNTNAFEIATNSKLSRLHNDQSVLENHHCNVTFDTLYRADCNFISHFSNDDRRKFRKRIIQAILGTDMSKHFELCTTLDEVDKVQFEQNCRDDTESFAHMIMQVFVHTADVTASCQPLLLAIKWGKKVCKEFTQQVQKEQTLGIESLPMMIGLQDNENFLKSQHSFIKFVLRPLFKHVVRLLPQLNHLYLHLLNNERYFADELENMENQKKRVSEVRNTALSLNTRISISEKRRAVSDSSIFYDSTLSVQQSLNNMINTSLQKVYS